MFFVVDAFQIMINFRQKMLFLFDTNFGVDFWWIVGVILNHFGLHFRSSGGQNVIKNQSKNDTKKHIEKMTSQGGPAISQTLRAGVMEGVKGGGKPPPWGQGVNKVMEEMKKWRNGYEWKREGRRL